MVAEADPAATEEERKAATENTYQRKIQELRHAIAFEQNYSKDWILERYLNLAYFGDGAYGIQAAARHYFSVNASQLNTIQSATLAGLEDALERERAGQVALFATHDASEGMKAFVGKRRAEFQGR